MKKEITAGMAIRREMRRFLLSEGIQFTEDKGWIDSVFYLNCDDEKWKYIVRVLQERERKLAEYEKIS